MAGVFPEVRLESLYDFNGKILLLPMVGQGPCVVTLHNVKVTAVFNFDVVEKNGKQHFKVLDNTVKLSPDLVKFKFDNLFNGNKELGDNVNTVINDNWKEIFVEASDGYETALGLVVQNIMNNFFGKVPVSELFTDL